MPRSTLSTMLHVSTCFSTFSAFSFNECTLRYALLAGSTGSLLFFLFFCKCTGAARSANPLALFLKEQWPKELNFGQIAKCSLRQAKILIYYGVGFVSCYSHRLSKLFSPLKLPSTELCGQYAYTFTLVLADSPLIKYLYVVNQSPG